MRRLTVLLVGAVAIGLVSTAAHAQNQTPGWYIGVQGGWTHLNSQSSSLNTGGATIPFTANADEGFGVGGVIGYELPSGLRAEGEVTYRSNDFTNFTTPIAPGSFKLGGSYTSLALMGNLLYDFMPYNQWTPYLGAGAGAAHLTLDSFNALGTPLGSPDDWEFAYQGIAGVKYAVNQNVSVSLDYRYFATLDPSFTTTAGGAPATVKSEYGTHNIFLGVAWHFAPPPPPPPSLPAPIAQPAPPPPPPAAQREFIVFFDFDRATLTPEALQVIQQASDAFRQGGSPRISVSGYTDLAGTQQYNLGLSKRRADAVHRQLVQDGVPDSAIAEAWHGKDNPRVPTPDGVREAQNRRVEIML